MMGRTRLHRRSGVAPEASSLWWKNHRERKRSSSLSPPFMGKTAQRRYPNLGQVFKRGEVFFLFPFDLSQVGSPPQNVFDFLQEDVSKEAFYDKPSWVDPDGDAWNKPASACVFPAKPGLPFVPVFVLCSCVRKHPCSSGQDLIYCRITHLAI